MTTSPAKGAGRQFWKVLKFQFILGGAYLLGILVWDSSRVLSASVGCVAALLPNAYFYLRMSGQAANDNAQQWLGYAYRTEFVKWAMAGMIFLLAFTSQYSWDPLVLFAGYVLIQISGWFVPFLIKG